jgi:L-serine dehydratase
MNKRTNPVSILNHVLGPVMRGPSSSHTAGAFHIASIARGLLGSKPRRAAFAFDPGGSYGRTYAAQGADRAFAMGLMGKPLTDDSFFTALEDAAASGLEISFVVRPLRNPDHPNAMEIALAGDDGSVLQLEAQSIGGGEVAITGVEGWPVRFDGSAFAILIEAAAAPAVEAKLRETGYMIGDPDVLSRDDRAAIVASRTGRLSGAEVSALRAVPGVQSVRQCDPVYFLANGPALFSSAEEMVRIAEEKKLTLGRLALDYESNILGLSRQSVLTKILQRYGIMSLSAAQGLDPGFTGLQLLPASAGRIYTAGAVGGLPGGGPHLRAAARAMAVMHVDGAMGVVCAAPTGGSAGVIPGTLITLAEDKALDRNKTALALLAAGAIGVIVARRATFAAEVCGCQVEIGAAGAMAAAAVVDAAGGTARQACDAAAIAFQNTMGSVCDLVQGMVEIPCHTRNAAAAASAFVCADLVLGGYANPIPLDETIDAVFAVGKMLPPELRCTSKGGLAIAPSALSLAPSAAAKVKGRP